MTERWATPSKSVIASMLMATCLAASSATGAVNADQVDASIDRGKTFLLTDPGFLANGHWEQSPSRVIEGSPYSMTGGQWGGRTALITYALLASGVSANDPRMRKPIEFLRRAELVGYYAIGLRPQVWLYLPPTPDNKAAVQRDYRLLWSGIEKDTSKPDAGLYDYQLSDGERIDLSVSQYGVLGMWACAQLGVTGDGGRNYWSLVDARWKSLQDQSSGSWSYGGKGPGTGSITAAGVATLFITQDHLGASEGLNCTGNARTPAIDKGLAFLSRELPEILSGSGYPELHYTLYGIERIGVASGLKYFDTIDWYDAGAAFLVRSQSPDGGWDGEHTRQVATSFSLLFLSRGREPVMMNKVKYDLATRAGDRVEGFWNQRGRDASNATRFVSRQSERGLNWQIVDLDVGTVRDLHDAPIAYIAGGQSLSFSDAQKAKLKQYVEEGGMLVFNADCGRRPFSLSIPKLLAELFPSYELRPLPETSPIYRNQQFRASNWRTKSNVRALSNGVRELAIVLEDDPAKTWQASVTLGQNVEPLELIANIYQYAIDKEHAQVKGRTHVRVADDAATTTSTVRVARLKYNGNWDPEPGGWRQFRAVQRNVHQRDVVLSTVDLSTGDLAQVDVAHLTGTSAMTLPATAVAKLKAFVDRGGLLVVDAAGGNAAFAQGIEAQLETIAGGSKLTTIPRSDPLYQVENSQPLVVRYRAFALTTVGSLRDPRLKGVKTAKGRWGVIYSPEDLSNGLIGKPVDGVRGYIPESATELMDRIVQYAVSADGR